MQLIGVDTGGTFTDSVLVSSQRTAVGKALTTHGRLMDGVMASLEVVAGSLGLSRSQMLADADIVAHGTTVGLNALLTGAGAKVGLLVTAGFESSLAMARSNKVHGLADHEITDALAWAKPKLLVPRHRILGVHERIDARGDVVKALDEAHARTQIRRLVDQGVEAIAISLLWSPVNAAHEERLRQLVAEEAPHVSITVSSKIAARIGEYERTATAAMNAYIAPIVTRYLDELEAALRADGFRGLFLVMTMGGGVRQAVALREAPIHVLQSGPVGGVTAAKQLGRRLSHESIIATDVGGTSFDVGVIVGGALPRADKPRIDRHSVAVPVIDLASIGTGGGSIAWINESLGALQVGPQSAGSNPGPACYGRGGVLPTVTDAAVVLGYLDRLGGSMTLDRAAAEGAVQTIAERLDLSVEAAAEGILRVANSQMADLVRRSTIQRGHDPRLFVLYAYGGAAPQYVGRYAAELGVQSIVVPYLAPEFSAWGAVSSDLSVFFEAEAPPQPFAAPLPAFDATMERLEGEAREELQSAASAIGGKAASDLIVERRVGLRFQRQIHKIDTPVAPGPLTAASVADAEARFRQGYERVIGRGSSYAESGVEIVTATVEARLVVATGAAPIVSEPGERQVRYRWAWFDGRRVQTPVHRWKDVSASEAIQGPAFVESEQTTLVVYPGQFAVADADLNFIISPSVAAVEQGGRP